MTPHLKAALERGEPNLGAALERGRAKLEEWRPVAGWPYEVSQYGRIRRSEKQGAKNTFAGRVLRVSGSNPRGYRIVILCKDGKPWGVSLHRLVAEAFHGPAPTPHHHVNHKNGDILDNFAENLEWVTPAENTAHAYRMGLREPMRGARNGGAKLTTDQAREIRRRADAGESMRSIARDFPVSPGQAARIRDRKAWADV